MFFRSYADMAADVARWSSEMPPFSGILGVPRSGLLVAAVLALYRNIPLLGMDEDWYKVAKTRREMFQYDPAVYPFLVLDDSTYTGATIRGIKEDLRRDLEENGKPDGFNIKYAAYMAGSRGCQEFDEVFWDTGDMPQLMEWSTLHIPFNKYTLCDLDGVISEDWPHPSEEGNYAPAYQRHLKSAKVLLRPTYRVRGIVTSRLEIWRAETEEWLAKAGIKYEQLFMNTATTEAERAANDGFAGFKSRVYVSLPDTQLFVESNHDQAQAIAFRSEKHVLDWDKKKLIGGRKIQTTTSPVAVNNSFVTLNQ